MKIKTFPVNPFQMNSYVYYCENTGEGMIIDPGYYTKYEQDELTEYLNEHNIKIKYIVNTHGHIDHVLGNAFAVEQFQAPNFIHEDDLFLYNRAEHQGLLYGIQVTKMPPVSGFITPGDSFALGNNKVEIVHTPGHSPGGICLYDRAEKVIFCGDTIFRLSIGRTDLPGGDYDTLLNSIRTKLFNPFDDDYALFPGHMESTTVGYEKANNPFLK
ncbi:MAG: MBL fold metallo-hydrolase [Bacteroidetes bacterium]|nr:MBL fold metallo-hydrolase [Bacteroidota bacterium]